MIWETIDGRQIPLDKVTDSHLKNIVVHLKKRISFLKKEKAPESFIEQNKRLLEEVKKEKVRRKDNKITVIEEFVQEVPNPGSGIAIKMGCTCAQDDNNHGRGIDGEGKNFYITKGCPLHWKDVKQ